MPGVDKALIGIAGVHFVVSELCLRGLIALPTTRNTAGVDVIVTKPDGSWHANLQVKTSKNKVGFWPVGGSHSRISGRKVFYVFLRYLKNEHRFEAFLEDCDTVLVGVKADADSWRAKGNKYWAPCWSLPKNEHDQERLHRQWAQFGVSFVP